MSILAGIDIGGTKCAVCLGRTTSVSVDTYKREDANTPPKILGRRQFATAASPDQNIDNLLHHLAQLMQEHEIDHLIAIGISCGGPLDSRSGLILSPPNLPTWDTVDILTPFRRCFAVPVGLQNDANACALAEWYWGAGRGCRNMIFLTFGTGMGAGLILNGQLYSGTNDMAGEVGHLRMEASGPVGYGKAGSLEGFCSGGGIAQLAQMMVLEKWQMGEQVTFCASREDLAQLDAKTVGDYAEAGDPLAQAIYRRSGTYLGRGLALLIDILNPEAIIIGSIFARRQALLRDAAMAVVEAEALARSRSVCHILPAGLGEQVGDYAALAIAAYGMEMGNKDD